LRIISAKLLDLLISKKKTDSVFTKKSDLKSGFFFIYIEVMKHLLDFRIFSVTENIDTSNLKQSIEKGLDNLNMQIRDLCVENTTQQYKSLVKIGYNRVVGKFLPLIKPYLIPTIKINDRVILQEKKTEPSQFFTELWPKFWDSFTAIEKGIIKKYTTLSKETTYGEIIEGAKSSMSEFGFDGFDEQFFSLIKETYKNSIIGAEETDKIEISSYLLDQINKDLGNSDENTDLIDLQSKVNKTSTHARADYLNPAKSTDDRSNSLNSTKSTHARADFKSR